MQKIYDRLVQVGDCWEWQGPRGHAGHGAVYHNGLNCQVHRLVWEDLRGPIPEGLELDHLCRNPPCSNPDHLDPVTHAVNMRRGCQSFANRTHCDNGHELNEQTVVENRGNGRKQCRLCHNAARRARRARARTTS